MGLDATWSPLGHQYECPFTSETMKVIMTAVFPLDNCSFRGTFPLVAQNCPGLSDMSVDHLIPVVFQIGEVFCPAHSLAMMYLQYMSHVVRPEVY